ncbi:MAG: FAD-dependent oxidoreductase [Hyphomicrobiales bacterium]|nr:FAD-dependent oxidoreductase [Hyphomicrobiales bacterium]
MARSIIVVGAGPAGLAAAMQAERQGARVTLVDEGQRPGGQIYRQGHPALGREDIAGAAELRRKHKLLEAFERARVRIDYRPNTSAFALFGPRDIHVASGDQTQVLSADGVILASGVREVAVPFPGWTTPGVMYAGGAQSLIKSQRTLPGRNVVVAGCGPLPIVVAAQILRAGGKIAAFAPLHSLTAGVGNLTGLWHGRGVVLEGLRYLATVMKSGVARLTGFVPIRARGIDRLESVVLARLDAAGAVEKGSEREIACDALVINYGFAANSELAALAGARMRHEELIGGWLPEVDDFGRTSVEGVFVAGDMAGLRGALVAETEGCLVGAAAAASPEIFAKRSFEQSWHKELTHRRRLCEFQKVVRAMLDRPRALWAIADDDTMICRCENVNLGHLRFAFSAGHLAPNTIKRSTRAAMGWCGGRTCLPMIAALAELHAKASPFAMMTPRPLARPVPLSALANQTKG